MSFVILFIFAWNIHYLVENHKLDLIVLCSDIQKIKKLECIHDKVAQLKKLTYFHRIKSSYKLALLSEQY